MSLKSSFNKKTGADPDPFEKRDVIRTVGGENLVSFDSIIRTGRVPEPTRGGSFQIDRSLNDAYSQALDQVTKNVTENIKNSPELQSLLNKKSWDRNERESWEKNISGMVSDEFLKIPGLNAYRGQNVGNQTTYSQNLNAFSHDIKDPQHILYSYVCAHMALSEGLVIQNVENQFLNKDSSESEGDLKKRGRYFFASGYVLRSDGEKMINSKGVAQNHGMAHAFILSADSGNIIDATYDDGRHYKKSAEPHSLEKFVLGQPLYSKDSTWIYDPYPYRTPEDIKANHPLSKVQLLSKESLQNLDGQKVNSKIALSADHSIALLTHTYANGTGTYYEVYARTSDSPETYLRTAKGMRKDLSDLLLAKLNGDTLRLDIEKDWISGDIKAILLKEDKPQIALSPDNLQKPAGSRETLVKIIQNNLGLEADGIWGPQTNQKFANLMAEVQFTKSYTRQFDDKSGDSAHPNFFYGEETRAAMYALQYDRQLIDAIDQLDQSGELDNLYHGPASVRDSVKHVDAQKTTAVQLTTDREIRASVSPISAYPGLENLKF